MATEVKRNGQTYIVYKNAYGLYDFFQKDDREFYSIQDSRISQPSPNGWITEQEAIEEIDGQLDKLAFKNTRTIK